MEVHHLYLLLFSTLLVLCLISTIESSDGNNRNRKSLDPIYDNENSMIKGIYRRRKDPFNSVEISENKQTVMSKPEIIQRINDKRRLSKIKEEQKKKLKKEKIKYKINNPKSRNADRTKENTSRKEVLKLFEKSSEMEIEDLVGYMTAKDIGLEKSLEIPKDVLFSPFNDEHMKAVKELINVLIDATDEDELVELGKGIKPQVNHHLFIYALTSTLREKDFGVSSPNIAETLPELFVSDSVMEAAKEKDQGEETYHIAKHVADDKTLKIHNDSSPSMLKMTQSVEFNQQSNKDKEKRLDYWRKDFSLNSMLYNWHIVHTPLEKDDESKMTRRGELFYNYYNQLLARYNHERLSVGLAPVHPYGDMDKPIKEGYTPHLGAGAAKVVARRPNVEPMDLQDPEDQDLPCLPIETSFFPECRQEIVQKIKNGTLTYKDGKTHDLHDDVEKYSDEKRGIDILGRFINFISITNEKDEDTKTCAGLNDLGHIFLARVHDPQQNEPSLVGPMDSYIFSARDPLFYRWHKYLDDIFQEYKAMQSPYTDIQLAYPDVYLTDVRIASDIGPIRSCGEVLTGCSVYTYQLSRGLDFESDAVIELELVRLDHFNFTTHIRLENKLQKRVNVNIRVFLATKYNEHGEPMNFNDQRLLWVLMDEWTQELKSEMNNIMRPSSKSTISETCRNRYIDLEENSDEPWMGNGHCGCSWPQHLHLPKGTREGMAFQLFTIVTKSNLEENEAPATGNTCGQANRRYPDNNALGFPFDRPIKGEDIDIKSWMSSISNMFLSDLKIRFTGKNVDPNDPESQDCPHTELDKMEYEWNMNMKPALETTNSSEELQEIRNREENKIKIRGNNNKKKGKYEKKEWDNKKDSKEDVKANSKDKNGNKKNNSDDNKKNSQEEKKDGNSEKQDNHKIEEMEGKVVVVDEQNKETKKGEKSQESTDGENNKKKDKEDKMRKNENKNRSKDKANDENNIKDKEGGKKANPEKGEEKTENNSDDNKKNSQEGKKDGNSEKQDNHEIEEVLGNVVVVDEQNKETTKGDKSQESTDDENNKKKDKEDKMGKNENKNRSKDKANDENNIIYKKRGKKANPEKGEEKTENNNEKQNKNEKKSKTKELVEETVKTETIEEIEKHNNNNNFTS